MTHIQHTIVHLDHFKDNILKIKITVCHYKIKSAGLLQSVLFCVATREGVAAGETRDWLSVAPEIYLPNRRIGQWRRRETILECVITAFPQAVNYWEKDGRRLTGAAAASSKHRVDVYDEEQHRLTLSLGGNASTTVVCK